MTDFKMKYQIVADAAKAKAEVKSFDDLLKGAGNSIGTAFAGPAGIAAAGVAAVGAAAVSTGVALFNLTKNAADFGSEIFDASKKTGLHAEALSAMKFAADQSGTSLEAITGGIAKFSKTVGEAADGSDKAAAKLKDFGIAPQDAINDLDGALGKVFQKIIEAPPGIERMTLAQKAFGKSGADLLPFIDSFNGDLTSLIKKAKDLGVTIDDEAARAADEFGDSLDTLNAQLAGVGRTIGTQLMPIFTEMATDISGWLAKNKNEVTTWGDAFAVGMSNAYHWAQIFVQFISDNEWAFRMLIGAGGNAAVDSFQAQVRKRQEDRAKYTAGAFDFGSLTAADRAALTPRLRSSAGSADEAGGAKRKSTSGDNRSDKQVYQDFVAELKKLGVTINSGFRTYAQQAALFAKLPAGQAARPGTSDHEFYRAVDLPAGVSQTTLERAARAAGVTLSKRNVHEGTGLHNHQGFRKGRSTGGGEEAAYAEVEAARRDLEELDREIRDGLRDMAADMIATDQEASENRLSIRQKESDLAFSMIEDMTARGEMTEIESIHTVGQLKLDILEEQKKELEGQIQTAGTIQRLDELRLEIDKQRLENSKDEYGYWKRITDEINKQNASLEKRNQRPGLNKRESYQERIERMAATTVGSGGEISAIGQLHDHFVGEGNEAAIAGVDALAQAFGGLGQAIGASVEAWVLYGSVGDNAQEVTAKILASIAQQAAIKAIFELAEGFAMLGLAFFGHPGAGPSATQHFIAAGMYGLIAGGAAVAGRAVAGDSMTKGGGSGSGSKSSSSGGANRQQRQLDPYSRQSDDVYISGRRDNAIHNLAEEIRNLRKMVSTASPGDVLVRGAQQKRGFIGSQTVNDIERNSSLGSKLLRKSGAR